MSDHASIVKTIAAEFDCSMSTVNTKAKILGIKLRGRTPEEHQLLLEAMKDVNPRLRKTKPAAIKAPAKKAKPEFTTDVDAYFKHGKKLIKVIKKRIAEIDKERVGLQEKLNALELLHPGSEG